MDEQLILLPTALDILLRYYDLPTRQVIEVILYISKIILQLHFQQHKY